MSIKKEIEFNVGKINKNSLMEEEGEAITYLKKKTFMKSRIMNTMSNLLNEIDSINNDIECKASPYYNNSLCVQLSPEEKVKLKKIAYKIFRKHLGEIEQTIESVFLKSEEEPEETEVVAIIKTPEDHPMPSFPNYNY